MPVHTTNLLNAARGLTLTNSTTDNTISVTQSGNVGTDATTDGAFHLNNTGNTGNGLVVYSNQAGQEGTTALGYFWADNTSYSAPVVWVRNDGATSTGVFIENRTAGRGLQVTNTVNLTANKTQTLFYSNQANTGGRLVEIASDNASSTLQETFKVKEDGTPSIAVVTIENSGTAPILRLLANANSSHIRFLGDPSPTSSDGDLWFDGTNFKCNIAGTVFNIDVTAA